MKLTEDIQNDKGDKMANNHVTIMIEGNVISDYSNMDKGWVLQMVSKPSKKMTEYYINKKTKLSPISKHEGKK